MLKCCLYVGMLSIVGWSFAGCLFAGGGGGIRVFSATMDARVACWKFCLCSGVHSAYAVTSFHGLSATVVAFSLQGLTLLFVVAVFSFVSQCGCISCFLASCLMLVHVCCS